MSRQPWRMKLLSQLPKGGVGVEVGVWKGNFSVKLLEHTKPTQLHLVDPWKAMSIPGARYSTTQKVMDQMFVDVSSRFYIDDRVCIYRMTSVDAAQLFNPGELDWVYLDGDHSYEGVYADLEAWSPLLKKGGIMCGDDYSNYGWWKGGVRKAVNDFYQGEVEVLGTQFIHTKETRR